MIIEQPGFIVSVIDKEKKVFLNVFNRPGLVGAVLQTLLLLIN